MYKTGLGLLIKSLFMFRLIGIIKPGKVFNSEETSSARPMPENSRQPPNESVDEANNVTPVFETSSAEPVLGEASRLSEHRYLKAAVLRESQYRLPQNPNKINNVTPVFETSSAEPVLGEASRLVDLLEYNRNFPRSETNA